MQKTKVRSMGWKFAVFYLIFGITFILLSAFLLYCFYSKGFNTRIPSGHWNFIMFIVIGIVFVIFGYIGIKRSNYFIEWDDREIRYLLPGNLEPERVRFEEIISVAVRQYEIEINTQNSRKTIRFHNFQARDIKRIKEMITSRITYKSETWAP